MLVRSLQRAALPGLLCVCLVPMLSGCGSDGLHLVSGEVTFDGQPLKEGRITFRKMDGDRRAYSAPITNGSYSLECEEGRMAVEITASRIIPGKFDRSNGTPEPVGEMYIPARYNRSTTLSAEVSSSSTTFPFELKSRG